MSNNLIDKDSFAMVPGITPQELEDKIVVGNYIGTGDYNTQSITLGQRPKAVLIYTGMYTSGKDSMLFGVMSSDIPLIYSGSVNYGQVTDEGFEVTGIFNSTSPNVHTYIYIAVM